MNFLLILLISTPLVAEAQTCDKLYQLHLKTDMQLSYKEFDQTMGKGFRSMLANNNCSKEVALLIQKYIEINNAKESSLRWHVAQSWAHAGDYSKAIEYSRSVLQDKEDFSKNKLRWNDFVLANIAFFEHNKKNLVQFRNRVANAKDKHFGNELNTKFLDSLIRHFGQSYTFAVEHIGK